MSAYHAAGESAAVALNGSHLTLVIVVAVVALLALAVAGGLVREVLAAGQGTERMQNISRAVQEGAAAYLTRQFRTLAIFVVIIPFLLLLLPAGSTGERIGRSVFFVVGAVFSALTGFIGMWLAVRGNVRVAAAARESGEKTAMRIAFRTGGVAGMFTVGLGLLGAAIVVLVYKGDAPNVLEGFGFGAALLAMFMRVGGGIFTKAADVGADLVGKVEQGIPEDDPRNAATIADNVGDNVGDCAGMAADLFESYAVTLVASLILGKAAFGTEGLVFPLIVPMIGVITAVVGIFTTAPRSGDRSGMAAINRGFFISAAISAVLVAVAAFAYLPSSFAELSGASANVAGLAADPRLIAIGAVLVGLVLASAIQVLTGYFTETNRRPVREIGESSLTGPATVILSGISVGLESAVYSALLIGGAVYGAFLLGFGNVTVALFAVALAGTGLLTTVGVIVSMDTFGPVSDNAQGIAEMSGDVEGEGARVLTSLDAVGNTTKAITKGIAIATAVLAATALFGSFRTAVESELAKATQGVKDALGSFADFSLSVDAPNVLVGLIIGAAVVFLFSGLAISAVGRAAGRVVYEVREQFRTKPGIMDGTELPDYGRVVDICTRDSLRELATPGLLAVLTPIAVGFALGYAPLGAYLAGAIAAGTLMAVFLANSGGAWDNAKKLVEDGHHGGKGSEAHAATVIGDTVGDPFKDTAGPAINPLIKVMNLVALLIAPAVVTYADNVAVRVTATVVAVAVVVGAVVVSKRRATGIAPSGEADEASRATEPVAH
ncbi:sodium-translocating pyrophosphatase [Microbispora bryophytorum]|uniref:K(+)-insensitive pyrophosphate-energized proton pump n=1 Tax=Microbispora bryophytorum TaxID=1460882 RepID=A0A8H9L892_9ACTN|nr:sodium-translocating pyrophosphatase [Microbispora bryophytorum]MBD3135644.1 sodium-translocating pyrophosphatase [Microbispora bryophytorum]TQS09817.1 sodium-translocating pyrophosphatase [Microbispora bryophytorum]GGN98675.1 K(+)-insensitive pyrophosphate-energized proton pump [Microbispora bryophytorum]